MTVLPNTSVIFITNSSHGLKVTEAFINSVKRVETWYGHKAAGSHVSDVLTYTQYSNCNKDGIPTVGKLYSIITRTITIESYYDILFLRLSRT